MSRYDVCAFRRKHRGHKPYIGTYASRTPNLMMIDPEYIKTVMTTDFKKFHDNDIGITVRQYYEMYRLRCLICMF